MKVLFIGGTGNISASVSRLAIEKGLGIIAFPNISTGIYGFPKEKARARLL